MDTRDRLNTIGDAIMAAFVDPAEAVAAAIDMHCEIAAFNLRHPDRALILNIGVHRHCDFGVLARRSPLCAAACTTAVLLEASGLTTINVPPPGGGAAHARLWHSAVQRRGGHRYLR